MCLAIPGSVGLPPPWWLGLEPIAPLCTEQFTIHRGKQLPVLDRR